MNKIQSLISYLYNNLSYKKILGGLFAISITIGFGFKIFSPSISIFSFNSLIANSNISVPTKTQEEDEILWTRAAETLGNFYRNINLYRYEEARKNLTELYAKNHKNYSVEKLKEWQDKRVGKMEIVSLEKNISESKKSTKTFNYTTRYKLKSGNKICGENLTAYVVFRGNKWMIDTIQIRSYTNCN